MSASKFRVIAPSYSHFRLLYFSLVISHTLYSSTRQNSWVTLDLKDGINLIYLIPYTQVLLQHTIYDNVQDWLLLHDNQSSFNVCMFNSWIIAFPAFISLLCISMYHNTVILTLVLVIYSLHKYKFQYPQLHIASQLMYTEH